MTRKKPALRIVAVCCFLALLMPTRAEAQSAGKSDTTVAVSPDRFNSRPLLTESQWQRLDTAVDRALLFIARNQSVDGSFPTHVSGQPGVTSLCVMALLSRGHIPNEGPYGKQLSRAIEYVLETQAPDGTLMLQRVAQTKGAHFEGNYNHSISGLMLGEVYGMSPTSQQERIRLAMEQALQLTRQQQLLPKRNPAERGGWRYMRRFGVTDADLSVTAWQLMFLRSARNAEFDVPQEWIDEALVYVRGSVDPVGKGFFYGLEGEDRYCTQAIAGAGIVSLALSGEHNTDLAKGAGDWILRNPLARYNRNRLGEDRYHYNIFYASQATFQLGGEYWFQYFPNLLDVLVENQNSDGSWQAESNGNDSRYGNLYSSALAVLALTPPYQILPIYQR